MLTAASASLRGCVSVSEGFTGEPVSKVKLVSPLLSPHIQANFNGCTNNMRVPQLCAGGRVRTEEPAWDRRPALVPMGLSDLDVRPVRRVPSGV